MGKGFLDFGLDFITFVRKVMNKKINEILLILSKKILFGYLFCVRNYGVEIGITGREVIGLKFEEGWILAAAERNYPPPPYSLQSQLSQLQLRRYPLFVIRYCFI